MNGLCHIPNRITVLRIVITICLGIMEFAAFQSGIQTLSIKAVVCMTTLTLIIYLTDLLDGYLARRWQVCSQVGERLDICADLLYIISQYYIMIWNGYMPISILLYVILEFTIFVLTSIWCRNSEHRFFLFDKIGRITAVYYYVMPLIYMLAWYSHLETKLLPYLKGGCLILTALAVIGRLWLFAQNKGRSLLGYMEGVFTRSIEQRRIQVSRDYEKSNHL